MCAILCAQLPGFSQSPCVTAAVTFTSTLSITREELASETPSCGERFILTASGTVEALLRCVHAAKLFAANTQDIVSRFHLSIQLQTVWVFSAHIRIFVPERDVGKMQEKSLPVIAEEMVIARCFQALLL
jgi:hypothetical protein